MTFEMTVVMNVEVDSRDEAFKHIIDMLADNCELLEIKCVELFEEEKD